MVQRAIGSRRQEDEDGLTSPERAALSPAVVVGSVEHLDHAVRMAGGSVAAQSEKIRLTAQANTYENFELAVFSLLATIMLERMAGNDEFVNRCLSDDDFKRTVFGGLAKELFESLRDAPDG